MEDCLVDHALNKKKLYRKQGKTVKRASSRTVYRGQCPLQTFLLFSSSMILPFSFSHSSTLPWSNAIRLTLLIGCWVHELQFGILFAFHHGNSWSVYNSLCCFCYSYTVKWFVQCTSCWVDRTFRNRMGINFIMHEEMASLTFLYLLMWHWGHRGDRGHCTM